MAAIPFWCRAWWRWWEWDRPGPAGRCWAQWAAGPRHSPPPRGRGSGIWSCRWGCRGTWLVQGDNILIKPKKHVNKLTESFTNKVTLDKSFSLNPLRKIYVLYICGKKCKTTDNVLFIIKLAYCVHRFLLKEYSEIIERKAKVVFIECQKSVKNLHELRQKPGIW